MNYSPFFVSNEKDFYLFHGDCIEVLSSWTQKFDMIFADPPYFLSNNGLTVRNGQIVSVNKGEWDRAQGYDHMDIFNKKWLSLVRKCMHDDATIWVSGTKHNIFSIGKILTELEFKILNIITWEKSNPPPNFSCQYFTHSTEYVIWARKSEKVSHYFNYELMKKLNNNKQMKDVWLLPAVAAWEKTEGKHPTQKPLSLLTRIILSSTKSDAWILDPFTGSSSTGIAANLNQRYFVGIDREKDFLVLSQARKEQMERPSIKEKYRQKIPDLQKIRFL